MSSTFIPVHFQVWNDNMAVFHEPNQIPTHIDIDIDLDIDLYIYK